MGLITGLCFSTVFLAWEGEEDGGPFYYQLSFAIMNWDKFRGWAGRTWKHGEGGESTEARMTAVEVLFVC